MTRSDGETKYRQIVAQIKYNIASGALRVGDELPAIRPLAEQLLVTPNTIVKAYGVLEAAGIIVKRQGLGTFVSEQSVALTKSEKRRIVVERIDKLLSEAKLLGMTGADLKQLLEQRAKRIFPD